MDLVTIVDDQFFFVYLKKLGIAQNIWVIWSIVAIDLMIDFFFLVVQKFLVVAQMFFQSAHNLVTTLSN